MFRWIGAGGWRLAAVLGLGGCALALAAVALIVIARAGDPSSRSAVAAAGSRSATATMAATAAPPTPTATPARFPAVLDGVLMSADEWQAREDSLPLAVMVDNAPGAFPQSGLAEADLVYEAFVEGGITRFMAVYWRRAPAVVEPVRSARTPFVIWASELGAMYGHAGVAATDNDANAMGQIAEWQVKDLDAFVPASSNAYYRDADRYAPHNLVGSGPKLRDAGQALGFSGPPAVQPWLFKADGEGTVGREGVAAFEVDFQERRYASQVVQWQWDGASNSYLRFQSGGPHLDATSKEQLRFKNVVVMRVPWRVVDNGGHVLLQQFGEGPASVFLDGKVVDGTWKKQDREARTRFYDAAGAEIAFNRGPIFIEVAGPASLLVTAASATDLPPMPAYEPPPPEPPAAPEPEDAPTPTAQESPSPSPSASQSPGVSKTPTPPGGLATPAAGTPTPPAGAQPSPSPSTAVAGSSPPPGSPPAGTSTVAAATPPPASSPQPSPTAR